MKRIFVFLFSIGLCNALSAQNIGVGTNTPTEKLDVNGNTRMERVILTMNGAVQDNLVKSNVNGDIVFKKGHRGFGLRYIICLQGIYPSQNKTAAGTAITGEPSFIGQLKIIAGSIVPKGWALCNGQLLNINTNQPLFSLLGNTYGGTYPMNFALPDLRATAPVCQGTNAAGYTWLRAQKSN